MSVLISGSTIIDGVSEKPLEGRSIWIENGRIKAIAGRDELRAAPNVEVIDARGKYVIPGLMNANVHLYGIQPLERVARHLDHEEDLIAEAAQVALKNGLTTVFDTWGPRRFLMAARDRINRGELVGSRVFCAGHIIGFDGPFSVDLYPKALEVASVPFARRINAIWVENVGRHLMWLTPEQVGREIRTYAGKGVDFLKYASNDHFPGAFLTFSPEAQAAIVDEAHRAGITAQAHSMSVEGLRISVEAGCDLVTHCNVTGPVPIPSSTIELMVKRKTGAVIFTWTQRGLDWLMKNVTELERMWWDTSETNARNLIKHDASLMLANDGMIITPEFRTDPQYGKGSGGAPDDVRLYDLDQGHFLWFTAMEEKGCPPMKMLQAATRNIAIAYGKDTDLGTLETGKIADLVILNKDPLKAAGNYRSIHSVIKDGVVIDRDALPLKPILTKPAEPADEESAYVPFITGSKFPICPMCTRF
jgi:imidazolonepropionase-like amidohydrolase